MTSYMSYKVVTRTNSNYFKKKEMVVSRRFSDFLGLHDKLAEKYRQNGRIIPPAPDKSVVGMTKVKIANEDQGQDEVKLNTYAWWNDLTKCFKICHIFGIPKPIWGLFFFVIQNYINYIKMTRLPMWVFKYGKFCSILLRYFNMHIKLLSIYEEFGVVFVNISSTICLYFLCKYRR